MGNAGCLNPLPVTPEQVFQLDKLGRDPQSDGWRYSDQLWIFVLRLDYAYKGERPEASLEDKDKQINCSPTGFSRAASFSWVSAILYFLR